MARAHRHAVAAWMGRRDLRGTGGLEMDSLRQAFHPFDSTPYPMGLAVWAGEGTWRVIPKFTALAAWSASPPLAEVRPVGELGVFWNWPEAPEVSR